MNLKKRWLVVLAAVGLLSLLLLSGCGEDQKEQTVEAPTVPQEALVDLLQDLPDGYGLIQPEATAASDAFLLDVRDPNEYATGFIEGTVNIPLRELTDHLNALPGQDDPIIVIAGDTHHGGLALGVLRLLGYQNVQVLAGGMPAWRAVYLPVVGQPKLEPEVISEPQVDPDLLAAVDTYLKTTLADDWGLLRSRDLATELEEAEPFVLDIRQPEEFARQRLENSVNIPLRELTTRLDLLPQDQPIVVVCASGYRSALAMMTLQLAGYPDVRSLDGGISTLRFMQATTVAIEPELDAKLKSLPDDWGLKTINQVAASDALIVDVREPDTYNSGFIARSINIPIRELTANLTALPDLEAEIIIVCGSGIRSAIGMFALQLLGYQNVSSMEGGIAAWTEAGQPLVTSPVPPLPVGERPEIDPNMLAAVSVYLQEDLPENWGLISYEDMVATQNDEFLYPRAVVIDVRESDEVAQQEVEGAFNLPLRDLVSGLERVPFEMPFSD
jgi:rhodanese-related sulfurtransferase